MKQLPLILSIVATALSASALFMFLNGRKDGNANAVPQEKHHEHKEFKIAYFHIDSIQNNYKYYKDQLSALQTKEQSMNNELQSMERSYQKKIAEWQKKGNAMSQSEAENANREYQQMQQNFAQKKQELSMRMENEMLEAKQKIKKNIEDYLKDYNKDKGYSFIMSYEPELMFYKDTVYNITNDVIRGLNERQQPKKN